MTKFYEKVGFTVFNKKIRTFEHSCTEKYDHCKYYQTILQFGAVCLVCMVFFGHHISNFALEKKYFFTSERLDCAQECTSYQMVWASDFYIIIFFKFNAFEVWGMDV